MVGAGEEQGTAGDVECREAGEDEREVDAVDSEPIEFRAPDTMPLLFPAVWKLVSPADWSGCELTRLPEALGTTDFGGVPAAEARKDFCWVGLRPGASGVAGAVAEATLARVLMCV